MDPELMQRYDEHKLNDTHKSAFIDDILQRLTLLTEEQQRLRKELQLEQKRANYYEDQESKQREKADSLNKNANIDPFVLVLIDGDGLTFLDQLVREGGEGGEQASRALRDALLDYLQHDPEIPAHTKLVIRVFANISGLAMEYAKQGILSDPGFFIRFVRGFNGANALCDYIDAGSDKEGADTKIKENLKLCYNNLQCKHIALGCSTDNSFAGFLREYRINNEVNRRISLIRGPPFASALKPMVQGFRTPAIPFDQVLRSEKLPSTRNGNVQAITQESNQSTTLQRHQSANAVRNANHHDSHMSDAPTYAPPARRNSTPGNSYILINSAGCRVDEQLEYDPRILDEMRSHRPRFCNTHYLNGWCAQHEARQCSYDHSRKLDRVELDTLRQLARSIPCHIGVGCRNPKCTCGHQCVHGSRCRGANACGFQPRMHNVDTSSARAMMVEN